MRNILVTGAAGLLGHAVANELLSHGYQVRGFDRLAGTAEVEWTVADVTDAGAVAKAMDGIDAVLHLAAIPNIWSGDAAMIMRVNTLGTWNIFEAAQGAGISRVVFCSSDSVAGYTVREGKMLPPRYAPLDLDHPLQATDPYALSKVLGEDIARSYAFRGMSVVALRPVFVAYPEMDVELVARARDPENYKAPALGDGPKGPAGGPSTAGGGALFHHIDSRDLARAFRLALELQMTPGEFDRFYLTANVTLAPEPTLDRLRRLHGDTVEVRDPERYRSNPYAPLYDLTHAEKRLGFVPAYDKRHLLRGLPGFAL
jgi:nucleoside-diphosphate-sugar epimerase